MKTPKVINFHKNYNTTIMTVKYNERVNTLRMRVTSLDLSISSNGKVNSYSLFIDHY